ncbi:hypothetical protein [Amycolatopsis sp. NPDC004625]|uniref:DUF6907 domain-containing protein n=1 Tax=Amycolatopsis sp. NPDC004625 TaxID=3154670 RepID=UPI0033A56DB6
MNMTDNCADRLREEVTDSRAFWQSDECRHWCRAPHKDADHVDDRGHDSDYVGTITLRHEKLPMEDLINAPFIPPVAFVQVTRDEGEAQARVLVIKCDEATLNLAQQEAEELITALQAAVELARKASLT